MFTTRFVLSTACFGVAVLFVATFAFVALSDNSQPEFDALTDEDMAQLLGGAKYTKGNIKQNKDSKEVTCIWPTKCPTKALTKKPALYSCFTCYSGQTQYKRAKYPSKIITWCDNSIDTECPKRTAKKDKKWSCHESLGSHC